jgi:hypothetical protein
MSRRPYRFVSRGRRELNKAFGARDIEAVKKHTRRELQVLMKLHGGATGKELEEAEPFNDSLDDIGR